MQNWKNITNIICNFYDSFMVFLPISGFKGNKKIVV